jgi:hypothetical protein
MDRERPNGQAHADLIRLGGLWKKTGRNGGTFLAGSLGQAGLLIFRNERKNNDREPDFDYIMFAAPSRDRDSGGQDRRARSADAGTSPSSRRSFDQDRRSEFDDDGF